MKKKDKKIKEKGKGFFADFRKFISRGNAIDLAVGVIIGTAFSAIVNGLVNILLNLCMWPVPGGLKGLVTVLPAASSAQQPPEGLQVSYTAAEFLELSSTKAGMKDMYTMHGSKYYYNGCSILDWGTLINAILTFIIIAVVLFIVIRAVAYFNKLKAEAIEKTKEEYYKKHPEARPVPVEPGAPVPTELDVLNEIRDLLKEQKK